MSQPSRQTGSMGDELTNAAMVGLLALVALTFVLRGAGSVTAWITRSAQPSGGPASGVSVLLNPSDPATALGAPGLSPVVYWIITGLMLTFTGILGTFVWLRIRRYTTTVEADPRRMAGVATRTTSTPRPPPGRFLSARIVSVQVWSLRSPKMSAIYSARRRARVSGRRWRTRSWSSARPVPAKGSIW